METKPNHGALAHFSLNVDNVSRAQAFYARVFGWTLEAWGPPGFFMISSSLGQTSQILGSVQERRELESGTRIIGPECTFAVDDIELAIQAVVTGGGEIVMEKSTILGVGHLIFFKDTEGNVLGAMQYESGSH